MKLHLGCGKKYLPGYIHVDIIDYEHIDHVSDVSKLTFIENESISEIYACHVLEHFKRNYIEEVLTEWYRVLEVNGVLRIAVPDFESISEQYQNSKDVNQLLGLLYGGQTYDYNFHHVVFDYKSLKNTLHKVGFIDIQKYDWENFLPENYDDYSRSYLPHMDFKNGRLMSLNVMGVKNESI